MKWFTKRNEEMARRGKRPSKKKNNSKKSLLTQKGCFQIFKLYPLLRTWMSSFVDFVKSVETRDRTFSFVIHVCVYVCLHTCVTSLSIQLKSFRLFVAVNESRHVWDRVRVVLSSTKLTKNPSEMQWRVSWPLFSSPTISSFSQMLWDCEMWVKQLTTLDSSTVKKKKNKKKMIAYSQFKLPTLFIVSPLHSSNNRNSLPMKKDFISSMRNACVKFKDNWRTSSPSAVCRSLSFTFCQIVFSADLKF